MLKFLVGFATAVVILLLAVFCYVRFGFVDPRADVPIGALESKVAMPSLDAAVDRRAPDVKNPLQPTDDNLTAGIKVYQANCASCHGDIKQPRAALADGFYPRAPQFLADAPDMPENQNFYIIQHGIRLSGMPAWKQVLSEKEMWQVTTLLSHLDKLPPQVSDGWKAMAGSASEANLSPAETKTGVKGKESMSMH